MIIFATADRDLQRSGCRICARACIKGPITKTNATSSLTPQMLILSLGALACATPIFPELVERDLSVDPAGYFDKYGFPAPVHDLLNHSEYVSLYDRAKRNPIWSIEQITPDTVAADNADRDDSVFAEDTNIPEQFRARLTDYYRSGYDRGHQAPAADADYSQEAMDQTFLLTNMCPQVGEGFNRQYWAYFEAFARNLTQSYDSVRIVTGPLYLPTKGDDGKWRVTYEVIGNPPNVAVPTHFFKLLIGENDQSGAAVGAFILPNEKIETSTKLTSFQVNVTDVELAIGSDLLPKLAESDRRDLCTEVVCEVEAF